MKTELSNEDWMNLAIEEARSAFVENEVPIGAVLVGNNELLYCDHNRTNQIKNPLAHAEILVIKAAIRAGHKYLQDYTLYVTVEPCLMCAGAIIWSRIGRVVFGCYDPKAGAVGSIYNALQDKNYNHIPVVVSGILADQCSRLMQEFFRLKRKKKS